MRRWGPASPRRLGLVAAAIASAVPLIGARADDERVTARGEVGAEYDSNVHRAERIPGVTGIPIVSSALGRAVVSLASADRLGDLQEVAFSVLGAGKLFVAPEARNEDVGVVATSGAWRLAVGERTRVGIDAAYYEAAQNVSPAERALAAEQLPATADPAAAQAAAAQSLGVESHDFRSLAPAFHWLRAVGDSGNVGVGAGYRWFVYKPLRSYDFEAPIVSAEYRLGRETADGAADWELRAGVGVELRRFAGTRLVPEPAGCLPGACLGVFDPAGGRHLDQFFSGQVDVTRTARVLIGAGYMLQWNRSNSYAESVVRHVGIFRFATPLPADLYLAARAELVYATYPDRIALAVGPSGQPSASIEEEARSQARAELSRTLGPRLQVIGRYSFYANALGGQGTYRRQTATLSLVFTTGQGGDR
jgi:hypothetical protein